MTNLEHLNYSDEFKKQVATEAYSHTPSGGYPEVADKYGLDVTLVFDWVKHFFPPPPAPFLSVHVWVGVTEQTANEFGKYFAYSESYWDIFEDDDLNIESTGCAFCVDLNTCYLYDEDLLFYHHAGQTLPIAELIKELPLSTEMAELNILDECSKRGLIQANAVFYYADPTQEIHEQNKLYNGLIYLGLFRDKK
jgi:hypothetical protein